MYSYHLLSKAVKCSFSLLFGVKKHTHNMNIEIQIHSVQSFELFLTTTLGSINLIVGDFTISGQL